MKTSPSNTIYRDFDIRGKYPEEINDEEVFKIATALTKYFTCKSVAIGFDYRPSAEALVNSLTKGFRESGVDVIHLGLTTTPMSYFVCGSTNVDMTIMVTASHMPAEYNGLKITIQDAKPVTGDILQEIRKIVGAHTFSETATHGNISNHALQAVWIASFKSRHDLSRANLKVVIDPANMVGILEIATFKAFEPDITVYTLFDTLDHTCPNHEANPLQEDTLRALQAEVLYRGADIGIAFDGDADRVGFVDELGKIIASDQIGALLARRILTQTPGATIICDVRTSKATVELIEIMGGKVLREKVGHTHIRSRMRKEGAVLGIELSGHFFFKETYFSEGGALPAFLIMELMKEEKKTLSALVAEVRGHFQSGEINSTVTSSAEEIYEKLKTAWPEGKVSTLDGLTLDAGSWWLNVRPSANDPVVRLNVESETEAEMVQVRDMALKIIRA